MKIPPHLAHLPPPSAEACAVSDRLAQRIAGVIKAAGGWISFARYMELALYAPELGYYSAGSRKLGRDGDFVTAPEISPLFGRCLARQVAQLIELGFRDVLEIGAGSGALAADVLRELAALGLEPDRYLILEVSADLRDRQRTRLTESAGELAGKVRWLDTLPQGFSGTMIGNEILDAMPVHVVRNKDSSIEELGVTHGDEESIFAFGYRTAEGELLKRAQRLDLPDDYQTEIALVMPAFVHSFGRMLSDGAILFIDYGFPAREYYHPHRSRGTLMCHYRHHAHGEPLCLIGLQDITAHVDFTAVATAAVSAGLEVIGYTSQARFLINCGITDILSATPADEVHIYAPLAGQAQQLLAPSEMGELFKVIALGKNVSQPLLGFKAGDKSHTL